MLYEGETVKGYIYATYTEIFGKNREEILNQILGRVNIEYTCKILSILGFYNREKDEEKIRRIFLKIFPKENISKVRRYVRAHSLITRHGVLLAWEKVLKTQNSENNILLNESEQLQDVFKLILILQEKYMHEREDVDINNFVMVNSAYNYYDCQAKECARSYYIFIKNKEMVYEMNSKFIDMYGVSIEDYIYMTTIVTSYILNSYEYIAKNGRYFSNNWHITEDIFIGLKEEKKPEILKYLKMMSFSVEELKLECEMSLTFCRYPLVETRTNCFFPLERNLLQNFLFKSLIYKIKDCYKDDGITFLNEFGILFQKYVEYICEDFCIKSKGKYSYIGEFKYGKPQKNSPDIIIVQTINKKKYVFVIEVKSSRLSYLFNDYINVQDEDINEFANRLIVKPLSQAFAAMDDVINSNVSSELTQEAEYIFLAVTGENFPYKENGLCEVEKEKERYSEKFLIRHYNAICIEELELLLQVISSNSKLSLVDIFTEYELNKSDSLKNMLRFYTTQQQRRNVSLLYIDYIYNQFKECACFDAITTLNDECCKRATSKYILPNIIMQENDMYRNIIEE